MIQYHMKATKTKKMSMFLSGLPDLANTGQFWPVLAKFGPLKASYVKFSSVGPLDA